MSKLLTPPVPELITGERRGMPTYQANPFLSMESVKSKTRRVTNKKGDMLVVGETGEIVSGAAGFWQAQEVDAAKFVKLYVAGVKALSGLSAAGAKVFEVLYLEMQNSIGKDRVYLSFQSQTEVNNLSRATFTRGLADLTNLGFIAPTELVSWYWVNPDYMWNGDRLSFIKEYRRKAP